MYEYRVKAVKKVVDGDTVDLVLDVGFHLTTALRFRLLGVDTPEMNSRDPYERDAAKAAKNFVVDWFGKHLGDPDRPMCARTVKTDSFGRWLADVYVIHPDGTSEGLAEMLLEAGHADPYEK